MGHYIKWNALCNIWWRAFRFFEMPCCHILLYNIASKYTLKKKTRRALQSLMVITNAIEHDHTKLISQLSPIAHTLTLRTWRKFPSAFEGWLMSMKCLVEEDWAYVYSLREGGKLCLLCIGVRSFPLLRMACTNCKTTSRWARSPIDKGQVWHLNDESSTSFAQSMRWHDTYKGKVPFDVPSRLKHRECQTRKITSLPLKKPNTCWKPQQFNGLWA
jgi:hypothetical protein